MAKYKIMAREFQAQQREENDELAKRYREQKQEAARQRELQLLRSPTNKSQKHQQVQH